MNIVTDRKYLSLKTKITLVLGRKGGRQQAILKQEKLYNLAGKYWLILEIQQSRTSAVTIHTYLTELYCTALLDC